MLDVNGRLIFHTPGRQCRMSSETFSSGKDGVVSNSFGIAGVLVDFTKAFV